MGRRKGPTFYGGVMYECQGKQDQFGPEKNGYRPLVVRNGCGRIQIHPGKCDACDGPVTQVFRQWGGGSQ